MELIIIKIMYYSISKPSEHAYDKDNRIEHYKNNEWVN